MTSLLPSSSPSESVTYGSLANGEPESASCLLYVSVVVFSSTMENTGLACIMSAIESMAHHAGQSNRGRRPPGPEHCLGLLRPCVPP